MKYTFDSRMPFLNIKISFLYHKSSAEFQRIPYFTFKDFRMSTII